MNWDYLLTAIYVVLGLAVAVLGLIILTKILSKVQMRTWLSEIDRHFSNKYHKFKKEKDVQKD
jgi:hypothetical protein